MANYARFMLMFLYSMDEVMPKVRSFAFSSDLAEVTELFNRNKIEDAIAKVLRDYSGGSTDYGQALLDFKKLCQMTWTTAPPSSLGDARNNHGETHAEVLKNSMTAQNASFGSTPKPSSPGTPAIQRCANTAPTPTRSKNVTL